MKLSKLTNAVGHIDDDLVEAAAKYKNNTWIKWVPLAACFAAVLVIGAAFWPLLGGNVETPSDHNNRYKEFTIFSEDSAIVWPWEYLPIYEKYTELKMEGVTYLSKGSKVSASLVNNRIGNYPINGYDEIEDGKLYTEEFEVYTLKGVDQSQFLAVKMEDAYYVFKKNEYAPPSTLAELMGLVDLSAVIELRHFSENGDGPDNSHFLLTNDDYIWAVLAECGNASFVEEEPGKESFSVYDRDYLTFTITSEVLGVYKVAMYITADGYLWTNAFDYRYLFHIGKEAADKIIKYAKENSTETEDEPYNRSVIGTITEITNDYILVDDSVLCMEPTDGITYKILLNDLRISRYVAYGIIKVGDTVQIPYEGVLPANNTLSNALSVTEVIISDEEPLILE